jgi:hypothetical protein
MLPVTSKTCAARTWQVNSQIASYRGIETQEYSFVDFFYRLGLETSLVNLACVIKLSWLRPASHTGFTHVTARRIAQPPRGDLCHEAPTLAVTRTSRSSATGSIDNSPGGFFLHW